MSALHEERQLNAGQRRTLIASRCRGAGQYERACSTRLHRWDACRSRLERAPPRNRESPLDRLTRCVFEDRPEDLQSVGDAAHMGLPVQRSTPPKLRVK
jgi:hypothetical protein